MKLLRKDTDIALKTLTIMARDKDKKRDTASLAREMRVSRLFLRRILQHLQKEGYLASVKGRGGGFWLNLNPRAIKIIKLIELFQGKVELQDCLFQKNLCPDLRTCVLRRKLLELETNLVNQLKGLTLEDLINPGGQASKSRQAKKNLKAKENIKNEKIKKPEINQELENQELERRK